MDNLKDDSYYIQRVINDINFLIRHTKDITKDKFAKEELLLDSIMFRFIQISEHIKKLTPTFKARHDKIPWEDITGNRSRIQEHRFEYNLHYDKAGYLYHKGLVRRD